MSLHPQPFPGLPQDTAELARTVFRRGNMYLVLEAQIGPLFADADFANLYAIEGAPGFSPAQLALILIFQTLENLSDREAADAVRARIDWKYALHLPLNDPGFNFSVLSDFRGRLVAHEAGLHLLELLLKRLKTLGLLRAHRQRSDATHVIQHAARLNRLELVCETMRVVLEDLATSHGAWLQSIAPPDWAARYDLGWRGPRLPRQASEREALSRMIGRDGAELLAQVEGAEEAETLRERTSVKLLAQIWQQQYELGAEGWQLRPADHLPPGDELIQTPHDPESRYSKKRTQGWSGYKVHLTETCDEAAPRLITDVTVTRATQADVRALKPIQQHLQTQGLSPQKHLADRGYVTGHTLADSQREGIDLIGWVGANTSWQSKSGGFGPERFDVDWGQERVTCPAGATSTVWYATQSRYGEPIVRVRFSPQACQSCPHRSQCTRAISGRSLTIRLHRATIAVARERQTSEAFRQEYGWRAGVEGTMAYAMGKHQGRKARYTGLSKTWLQQILIAAAINLRRSVQWLIGKRPEATRISHFQVLMSN